MPITHAFVSGIADGGDTTLVRPQSDWNAAHTLGTGEVLPIKVLKTADEGVTNSAVLQNDDQLLFAVGANEVWEFGLSLLASESPTVYAYLKIGFSVPTGGVIRILLNGDIGATTGTGILTERDGTTTITDLFTQVDPLYNTWLIWGRYVGGANAGNVQFQFAQAYQNATRTTKVKANSFIIAHKLA